LNPSKLWHEILGAKLMLFERVEMRG